MVRKLLEEYEKWGLKINLEKKKITWSRNKRFEDQNGCIIGCQEFEYLVKEDRQENYIKKRINKVRINLPLFFTVLTSNSCCFCPVGLSLLIQHFQQVLWVSKFFKDGRTVENKGKLILTETFPSVQKHDI